MPEYIPSWRRKVRRRAKQVPRPIYGGLSLIALGLLWIPATIYQPISNQLAQGSRVAWVLFSICGLLVFIQAALMAKAPDLLAEAPRIEQIDVLAAKLPG